MANITRIKKSYTGWCQQIDSARDIAFQQYIKLGEAFFHIQSREYYNEWKKDPELVQLTKEERARIIDKDDYYKWRWGYSKPSVSNFVRAYQVCEVISSTAVDEKTLPSSEWVARPLTRLLDDVPRLLNVWQEAVELAPNNKPTIRHIEKAFEKEQEERKAKALTEANRRFKERERLKAEEEEAKLNKEKNIVELPLEVIEEDEEDSVNTNLPSDEDFEELVTDALKDLEQSMRKQHKEEKFLQEMSVGEIAKRAEEQWKIASIHFSKHDKVKVAKAYIKMLYKKYPQLMDEV